MTRRDEAASRPKSEFVPKTLAELNIEGIGGGSSEALGNGGRFFTSNSNKTNHQNSNSKFNNNNNHFENNNKRHQQNLFNNRTNNNNNNSNGSHNNQSNLFNSQQNLAKTNIIHTSNFTRSRTFGSQQSLSTASNHSNSTNSINSKSHSRPNTSVDLLLSINSHTTLSTSSSSNGNYYQSDNSRNSYPNNLISSLNDINSTDAWLNAWNSPPSVTRAPNTIQFPAPNQSSITTTTTTRTTKNHLSILKSQNGHNNDDPWTGEVSFFYFLFSVLTLTLVKISIVFHTNYDAKFTIQSDYPFEDSLYGCCF